VVKELDMAPEKFEEVSVSLTQTCHRLLSLSDMLVVDFIPLSWSIKTRMSCITLLIGITAHVKII
jgi:hypothetical protein